MIAFLYLLTIVVANLVTLIFLPTRIGILVIPPSSYFMGFTFILGNLLQDKVGNRKSKYFIWIGLVLSALICFLLQFSQSVVIASGIAFIVSQLASNSIYRYFQRTKIPKSNKDSLFIASAIGSLLDVILFVVLGLSPIGINSVRGFDIILAIVSQFFVQTILQYLATLFLSRFKAGGKYESKA